MILWNIFAYSDTNMVTMDNDAFAGNGDGQYTGGLFYTWMSDSNNSVNFNFMNHLKTNNGISFEHLIFTPNNKRSETPVLNDIPYAGYAKLNFLLYKSSQNHFHEFGFNLGMVGPITRAKELQSEFHTLIGHSKPDGWDTQLQNQATVGIAYNYAQKTTPINIYKLQFDWTNNARFDIGNFYSGALVATTVRIGSKFPNTFPTTGNFIDGDESSLINFHATKEFNWAISLGFFANRVNNYYIIDEAIKQGYDLSKITYFTGEQVAYDVFYNNLQYTFKIKSIYAHNNKLISGAKKQWGGITVIWKF
jgi:hypothetical protein